MIRYVTRIILIGLKCNCVVESVLQAAAVVLTVSQSVNSVHSPIQALFTCVKLLEDQSEDIIVCGRKVSACLKVETHEDLI